MAASATNLIGSAAPPLALVANTEKPDATSTQPGAGADTKTAKQSDASRALITPCDPWPRPYFLEGGLRRVAPYFFTYNTWCKERWRGRQLIDVFESEFRDRAIEYYHAAMESGQVMVNSERVGPSYILKNGDLISHTTHRHEPPITAEPIQIIHEDEDMIVINKPSGVPVHPAGRYQYNSVVEIVKSARSADFLPRPCNRLDRLTSGIMFLAKTKKAADLLGSQIVKRTVRKEYMARVVGRFPDGEVVCDEPILQISPKLGLNRVRANGKTARTVFKRLAYYPASKKSVQTETQEAPELVVLDGLDDIAPRDGFTKVQEGYSIVRCLPVTGRTHQIRVHLQFLGHPIQNDPIYANQKVWGFNLGCSDPDAQLNSDEDIISRLSRMGKDEAADAVAYHDEMVDAYYKKREEKMSGELCTVCDTPLYTDPGQQELSLWLHSLRYEDAEGAWSYCSSLPRWALPPAGIDGPVNVGGMEDLVTAAAGLVINDE
ncbi:pseudouridine synthase [Lasiosphaeria hispida]|uniref:Pseudouridine synthase n=1 Tax=Lasiosphaeria hispida TaxID=260671 RepID=A0AAJ0HEN0_9PEZI|nr:pseudouridine synthase [Lasiosphaeria hispida]